MADEAPTFEDQTADFVVETAEPETPAKEDKPNAEAQPKPAEEAPAPATEETDDDAGETGADKPGGETGEPDAGKTDGGGEPGSETQAGKRKLTSAQRSEQIQRRTDELIRAQREAERRLADIQARLGEAEKPRDLTDKGRDTTKEAGDAPPDPNDAEKYPYGALDEQYLEDRTNYAVEKALKTKELKDEKARQTDAAAAKQREMQQKRQEVEKAGAAKYEDFHEVVVESAERGEWPLTPTLGELILTSPEGADVAYHLASNPKVAREIAGKSPMEQAAWFGRIAAKFPSKSSDAPAKPAVKTTQAPPPVKPARGAGVNPGFDPNNGSFEEFERHFRAAK